MNIKIFQQTKISPLSTLEGLETIPVIKALGEAKSAIGELRGIATTIPNPDILLDTLPIQEALASSAIENIVTTQDEFFQVGLSLITTSVEAKEVFHYREAMRKGYEVWLENQLITERMLIEMYQELKQRNDGYRQIPGAFLLNEQTGEKVYEPPQNSQEIERLMAELEKFINDDSLSDLDPLIKMALIHHQFESIHPFSDGNGRVGRMLNVLYLTHKRLLDKPILYLSREINRTKNDYYRLLQETRNQNSWEAWVIYMLQAVEASAKSAVNIVQEMRKLMAKMKKEMRNKLPKLYSQDLLNNLFRHPYTRIDFVAKDLGINQRTASIYLKQLGEHGFVKEAKQGRNKYYVNEQLMNILLSVSA